MAAMPGRDGPGADIVGSSRAGSGSGSTNGWFSKRRGIVVFILNIKY